MLNMLASLLMISWGLDVKVSLGQKAKVAGGQNLSVLGTHERSADTSPETTVPALIFLAFLDRRKLAIAQL